MKQVTVGFIGCGNMGGALLRAVAKGTAPERIGIFDCNEQKTRGLCEELGVAVAKDASELASAAEFLVLGVKPQGLAALGEEISPVLARRSSKGDAPVLVSMAAGKDIAVIDALFGTENTPVVRIMPNTPAAVGEGMILFAARRAEESVVEKFRELFSPAGLVQRIDEDKMDAAGALSGCGPAFFYIFMEALADGAVECGIPRDLAVKLAAQTALGSAKMLLTFGHPGDLKDAVCSPGGTTIAGVHALESEGFRAAAMDAVLAAYDKTRELKG